VGVSLKLVRRLIAACCAGIVAVSAAACGAGQDTRTEITVWSWEPSMQSVIDAFEKENPDIHVVWENTSGYNKLNNAIQDGYGIPDVVQLEYYALRQYAVSSQLVDITDRTSAYEDFYTPGTWASVRLNDRVYGLPMDSGPMAFFYNEDVFEQVGVDASQIRTWDEYYEAAKKLKEIGVYITADSGDASFYSAMIWLAGGRPFSVSNDGKNVTIKLTEDSGTNSFTKFWQKMIDEGLVYTGSDTWSDKWKETVGSGKVASLFAGAWMPSLLMSNLPGAAGLWRVAQMPTEDGRTTTSENGGSALAVLQRSRKPEASYRFVEYVCHNADGIKKRVDGGAFPADNNTLSDYDFLGKTTVTDSRGLEIPYFGGQEYNRVLSKAAESVSTGYQYLPFEVYARSDFESTVGKAYKWSSLLVKEQEHLDIIAAGGKVSSKSNSEDAIEKVASSDRLKLKNAIALWQKDLKEYGANQGFTIQ
jgi:multiple sugar transport system substrate-binding protein